MERTTLRLLIATGIMAVLLSPNAANARNMELESNIRRLNDLSDFYHALVFTGVADELHEGTSYTVLAPTDSAFTALITDSYPCFYQPQCHDYAVAFVRAHILEGRHPLQDLAMRTRVETIGKQWLHTDEPYQNLYKVNGAKILSSAEVGDNIIYRLDGFVVPEKDMAVFRTASAPQPTAETPAAAPAETIVTKTTTTYVAPADDADGSSHKLVLPGTNEDRTTIRKTTTTRIFEQSKDQPAVEQ